MLNQDHAQWLSNRAITPAIASAYGLGSAQTNRGGLFRNGIEIPYTTRGKVITVKTRWLDGREPKWTHPGGGKQVWNADVISESQYADQPLIVTEGEWDALASILTGYLRTISVPCGATGRFELQPGQKKALLSTRRIVLCGDNDEPGRQMNAELARRFGAARCFVIDFPDGCKDLNEILISGGEDAVREAIENAKPYPIKGLYTLNDYPAGVEYQKTYSTGWKSLDPHLQLWRGEFCVITGIPGHGKSRWALELMGMMQRHHQHKAAIASFEMPTVPYVRNILREHFHARPWYDMTEEQKARADVWIESNFYFIDQLPADDKEEANLEWIVERSEDAVCRYGVDWLLLDPWNQIEHRRQPFENEMDYQARAIRAFKRFARVYGCGVFIVAHPTKGVVDGRTGKVRRPSLYDVSGSAHWANGADHGIVIWREDLNSPRMLVSCLKSRYAEGGKPGSGLLDLLHGRLESYDPTQWPR